MGILNLTPDSRYGSHYFQNVNAAVDRIHTLLAEGASIIDIGGESTRPGATQLSVQEELDRVMPVVEKIAPIPAIISIDTYKPEVMQAVIHAGVDMINDVTALRTPGALEVVRNSSVAICLMHMQGTPQTMQNSPTYENLLAEIKAFLYQRLNACLAAGIHKDQIILDPGFGFGKSLQHNLRLLNGLDRLTDGEYPILVGLSRKSMLQQLLGLSVDERLPASLALGVIACMKGARIIRTHDVKATYEAIRTAAAVLEYGN